MAWPTAPARWGRRSLQSRQGRQKTRFDAPACCTSMPKPDRNASPALGDGAAVRGQLNLLPRLHRVSAMATARRPAKWS